MKRPDLLPTTVEGKIGKFVEEAGECLQCIGKAQRHGWKAVDVKTGKKYDNWADLRGELIDLIHSASVLLEYPLEAPEMAQERFNG